MSPLGDRHVLRFTQLELFVSPKKCLTKNVRECNPPKPITSSVFFHVGVWNGRGTKAVLTSSRWSISKTAISRCCEVENNGSVFAHVDSCTASVKKRSNVVSASFYLKLFHNRAASVSMKRLKWRNPISLRRDLNEWDFHFLHWVWILWEGLQCVRKLPVESVSPADKPLPDHGPSHNPPK